MSDNLLLFISPAGCIFKTLSDNIKNASSNSAVKKYSIHFSLYPSLLLNNVPAVTLKLSGASATNSALSLRFYPLVF